MKIPPQHHLSGHNHTKLGSQSDTSYTNDPLAKFNANNTQVQATSLSRPSLGSQSGDAPKEAIRKFMEKQNQRLRGY